MSPGEPDRHAASGEGAVGSGTAREVFVAALKLGLTSFGGPIAHLGYFRDEYVVRRKWLDDPAYGELVGLCQFLPGPASSQLGFAIGWMRAGWTGAAAAWAGFTLPSALLMFAAARLTQAVRGELAQAVTHGLKVAAVAIVAQALVSMALTLTPDLRRIAIAAIASGLTLAIANPAVQVALIAAGAVAGMLVCNPGIGTVRRQGGRAPGARLSFAALAAFALFLLVLTPLAGSGGLTGLSGVFYRAGALVFGGGHVVLPLLRHGLVPGWMNDASFLTGYGAAQAMPGPLFTVATYLGASAMPSAPIAGAAAATVAIFAPGLLLVTGSLGYRERLLSSSRARRAISGVNAVVVGLLGAALYDPLWTTGIGNWIDMVAAGTGLLLLLCFRTPPVLVVALCTIVSVAGSA